ncbi:MAG: proprotein convertase P-domain-containing protein [Actinomycetota bacterium]|nr:proprotein convertase P-domain-containing protein [Actinomycetota bacterium]
MRLRSKVAAAVCGSALVAAVLAVTTQSGPSAAAAQNDPPTSSSEAPPAMVNGLARDLGISEDQARKTLKDQASARVVLKRLPESVMRQSAGKWFDDKSGKLTVAVTDQATADTVRAAGAQPALVGRSKARLDEMMSTVRDLAAQDVPGLNGYGVDEVRNDVLVRVNRTKKTAVTERFLRDLRAIDGVRVEESNNSPVQQAGEVNPGDGWWPGSETACSVGVAATDSNGGKHFITAGHCTNDANQAAYGQSGQQNRVGTGNVGGTRSINGREGDMGVVAVTEPGWTLSAAVNTWGQPAITVTGSKDAIVGETVCHSGNTAPNFECGRVTKLNHTMDYGSVVVEGLTVTTACSQGGDSGGVWLAGDKAIGLHEGAMNGNSCPSGDNAVFQPLNEALQKWNLTLVAGGGDTQAPTAPGNARSTSTTSNSVALAWDASTDNVGVTGYDVYNGSSLATSVAGTSATVSGLAADTSYTFTVKAKDAAGNKSKATNAVSVRTKPGGGGGERTFTNGTDFPIRDFSVAISPITSTATGAATTPVKVLLNARHTCLEDLNITLVGPSGRWYVMQRYGGYTCTPFPANKTYSVPVTGEQAGGKWTIRIGDNGPGDTGVIDSWSITV